jgi:hypothetical protein
VVIYPLVIAANLVGFILAYFFPFLDDFCEDNTESSASQGFWEKCFQLSEIGSPYLFLSKFNLII